MENLITCREAQQQLIQIKSLEAQLDEVLLFAKAETRTPQERTEAIIQARKIKLTLETAITELQEQTNPFERLFNLKEQYQKRITTLETAKIFEIREINGETVKGVIDIEGEFQPLPTLKEVVARLREKKELLEIKQTQGFGKIRLVPFGMSLEDLIEKHKQVLIKHAEAGKLFTARKNLKEKQAKLDLDLNNPMYVAVEYKDADKNGTLVYHPTSLTPENHGGYTKSEILKQRREKHKSGWDITILENEVNIPRKGKGKAINGRNQIETEKSPEQYLQLLQTPEYRGETGLTPEENLIHAITELVEHDEVIDEYQGNGSISFNIGAYFKDGLPHWADASGLVPYSYFARDDKQADLSRFVPTNSNDDFGLRSGVRV